MTLLKKIKNDYPRILVKVSGERLAGREEKVTDRILATEALGEIADELIALQKDGVQVGVVVGAGNILRGKEMASIGIHEATAHQMGMLSIVINALALQSVIEQKGVPTRVMSALQMDNVCELFIRRRAERHLEKGRIVIFAAGTGNPFFTSDTAGALRAIEIGADLLIKATKVDGIYESDPKKNPDAKHMPEISYTDVLVDDLKVMDATAIALCREHGMPLMVCQTGQIVEALKGKARRTLVS